MASLTQWTRTWANSRRQWRTGKSGMLQFKGHKESDTTYQLSNNREDVEGWQRRRRLLRTYVGWCPREASSLSSKMLPVKTEKHQESTVREAANVFYRMLVTGAQTPRDVSVLPPWCHQLMPPCLLSWEKAGRMIWRSSGRGVPGGVLGTTLGDALSNKTGWMCFTLWLRLGSVVESEVQCQPFITVSLIRADAKLLTAIIYNMSFS